MEGYKYKLLYRNNYQIVSTHLFKTLTYLLVRDNDTISCLDVFLHLI